MVFWRLTVLSRYCSLAPGNSRWKLSQWKSAGENVWKMWNCSFPPDRVSRWLAIAFILFLSLSQYWGDPAITYNFDEKKPDFSLVKEIMIIITLLFKKIFVYQFVPWNDTVTCSKVMNLLLQSSFVILWQSYLELHFLLSIRKIWQF